MVLLPHDFFLLGTVRSNSRRYHNDLRILPELELKALQQLWCKTISFLGSEVYWGCNQKSLSIKDGGQIRIVSQHLPDLYLTFARDPQNTCSCSLTRVRKFFQIHNIQESLQFTHICLKNGRTSTDDCHGDLDSNDFNFQPFSRFPFLLDFARIFWPMKHLSPARRPGGTNFIRSARSRRISFYCWTSR